MRTGRLTACLVAAALLGGCLSSTGPRSDRPIIVAHRGACGYLPEHTLAAKAMAHAMGADFIEQDVVLTRDHHPVVLHDIRLDTVTDVAAVYPERAREDGRFYAIDFTLPEIKRLRVTERRDHETGKAVYPDRFPCGKSSFRVPTLAEEIELIQGLNRSTGREVGIYTEIKDPAWHRRQGMDISRVVLATLDRYGYREKTDAIWIQCFDPIETARLRRELGCRLRLVQLIGSNDWEDFDTDFDRLRTPEGLKEIAGYADGIGPWMPHVVAGRDGDGRPIVTPLVRTAHDLGLAVHPFTFRRDSLPDYVRDFDELLRLFLFEVRVDGLFTDFPEDAVRVRDGGQGSRTQGLRR